GSRRAPGRAGTSRAPVSAHEKARPKPGSFIAPPRPGSGCGLDGLDAGGQAALVAGGLVLVDQAARAEAVEDRLGDLEGALGAGGVVLAQGLEHLLHGGAQHRTLAGVTGIAHDSLLGALLGGLDVCHGVFLKYVGWSWKDLCWRTWLGARPATNRQEIMGDSMACVNNRSRGNSA